MNYLLVGLLIFFGVNTVPTFSTFTASLERRFGALQFKGFYSLVALTGFVLILVGMSRAAIQPVYTPPAWAAQVATFAMPLAFCLLVAAYVPNNFRRVIRHPMLSGVFLWALLHLAANGDLASVLLFGSFGVYAIVDMLSVNHRSAAAVVARQPLGMDILVLTIGFAAFLGVRHFHEALFGVAV